MVALFNKAGAARGSKGFTLVELLVVIVVIGVLAAIAVPIFLSQSDKANDAALKSDLANAAKMLQVAEANGETLPSTMTAGQVTDLGTAGTITPNVTLTVSGSGSTLCVEGTSDSGDVYSADMDNGLRNYDCDGNENGVASLGQFDLEPATFHELAGTSSIVATSASYDQASNVLTITSATYNGETPYSLSYSSTDVDYVRGTPEISVVNNGDGTFTVTVDFDTARQLIGGELSSDLMPTEILNAYFVLRGNVYNETTGSYNDLHYPIQLLSLTP